MASPHGRKRESFNKMQSPAEDNVCFLDGVPSKKFTSSTVRLSIPGSKGLSRLSSGNRKLSVEVLSVEALPMNDDCSELIEERERSIAEQEKSLNKSLNKADEEQDISILKSMSQEEMQEHVSRCLQLSTENKINTKNAFALKLIDCMSLITKSEDKSNFAAMAYQLDAGAKIYSSRVDAVHQQVVKLVESCMYATKKNNDKASDEDDEEADDDGAGKTQEKKKKPKKKVISTNDQISRQPKENDPKDKFIRLEALPGDIMNKARLNPSDLSLTLDKNTPFWVDWQRHKLAIPEEKESMITEVDMTHRKLNLRDDTETEMDLTSISHHLLCSKSEPKEESIRNEDSDDDGLIFPSQDSDNESMNFRTESSETPQTHQIGNEENQGEEDIEVLNLAKNRMTSDGSTRLSTHEVVKTLFHRPGDSDYHYLKMDNSILWAGPSYWKRPQGHNLAEFKKKNNRKKKEPVEVQYTKMEEENVIRPKRSGGGASNKKPPNLNKKTMAKWAKKKVTYPQYIEYEPDNFLTLFNMDIVAEVAHKPHDESAEEEPKEMEVTAEGNDRPCSPDIFGDDAQDDGDGDDSTGFKGFDSETSSSSLNSHNGFKGWPSPGGSARFDPEQDQGFLGFSSQESSQDSQSMYYSYPSTAENGEENPDPSACDAYEGENLVPMVKTVKVDPIKYKTKPNRVDMHHLKTVMMSIIHREIEDRENKLKEEGSAAPEGSVLFRDVLSELYRSNKLHRRTRDDLSFHIAFTCLLTLANEHGLDLKNDPFYGDDGLVIKYYKKSSQ